MFWILYILQSIVDACFSMLLKCMHFFSIYFAFLKLRRTIKRLSNEAAWPPRKGNGWPCLILFKFFRVETSSYHLIVTFVVAVQLLSHVWLFVTPWNSAHQASLSFTVSQRLLQLMSIESIMLSNHLIPCHPLLLLPLIFPTIRAFSSKFALHITWPNYGRFSLSINHSMNIQDWLPWWG